MSIEGFIQQLAVSYVGNGYFFYVAATIPETKEPAAVDAKLIARYKIDRSKFARHRRKAGGEANVQYLRFRRAFVLTATEGEHEFFRLETDVRDVRRHPIDCFGYRIRCWRDGSGRWHPTVQLSPGRFDALREQFVRGATHQTVEEIDAELLRQRFIPFAGVKQQVMRLLTEINAARKRAGLEEAFINAFSLRRRSVKPFGEPNDMLG